jgi:hypothetical protein
VTLLIKLRADQVKHALSLKHRGEVFFTEVKTGPTLVASRTGAELQILDALAIKKSWSNPCFTGYEVKVSRSDFMQDNKWANYRNYCHKLYFACPSGLIKPEELPVDVGLVWVNEDMGWSVRKAALFRPLDIPWEMLYYLVISRSDNERHPFFGGRREYLQAFVADKAERRRLSSNVSSKFRAILEDLEEQKHVAESQVKDADNAIKAAAFLLENNIDVNGWMWETQLRDRFASAVPPRTLNDLHNAKTILERAIRALSPPSPTDNVNSGQVGKT